MALAASAKVCCIGSYSQLDEMTLVIEQRSASNGNNYSSGSKPSFSGSFKQRTMTVALGDVAAIGARVSVSGGSGYVGVVTINVKDHNDDYKLSGNFSSLRQSSVETDDYSNYDIDTNKAPWNQPGTYVLRLWAKDSNGEGGYNALDEMTLVIEQRSSSRYSSGSTLPDEVFIQEERYGTCTLASATMMMRSIAYKSGSSSWSTITEAATHDTAWIDGTGLRGSFEYRWDSNRISVTCVSRENRIDAEMLKDYLDAHPEGIVLYVYDHPHAVFLTDYVGDTFYCADPAGNYAGKRIRLDQSFMCVYYGWSQAELIRRADKIWYIESAGIKY